jgi:hypothetical protein
MPHHARGEEEHGETLAAAYANRCPRYRVLASKVLLATAQCSLTGHHS